MCIPFYKKIIEDRRIMQYFLLLGFLFAFLIPWCIKLIEDYTVEGNELYENIVAIANSYLSNIGMNMVLGYSFYFVLGYFLDSIKLDKKQRLVIYILGVIGFAFTILVDLNLSLKLQQPCGNYYDYFNVNVLLEAIFIHTFFKYRKYENNSVNSLIVKLGRYTFGIYLIHVFFIEKLSSEFNFGTLTFNSVASVPVISCVVLIISLIVSAVLNHIPIIKKYSVLILFLGFCIYRHANLV